MACLLMYLKNEKNITYLPEMEENLEFILNVFSFDDFEYEDKHDVKIEFN